MKRLAPHILWLVLAGHGCAATRTAAAPPTQKSEPAESVEDEFEEAARKIRADIEPAVQAYREHREVDLRNWIAEPSTRPAYRVYGAYLLLQLGVEDAPALFVASFPTASRDDFDTFWRLEDALSGSGLPYLNAQKELICGAVAGWPGASDKLIEIRPLTDASTHTDNCCGLALLAVSRPDATIALIAGANQSDELLHAFEEEASPDMARKLLEHIQSVSYVDEAQEKLRKALLPILQAKAGEAGPAGACEWIRCTGP